MQSLDPGREFVFAPPPHMRGYSYPRIQPTAGSRPMRLDFTCLGARDPMMTLLLPYESQIPACLLRMVSWSCLYCRGPRCYGFLHCIIETTTASVPAAMCCP